MKEVWAIEDKRVMIKDIVTATAEAFENESLSEQTRETILKALVICLFLATEAPEAIGVAVIKAATEWATAMSKTTGNGC
jgi:hypothetical protein